MEVHKKDEMVKIVEEMTIDEAKIRKLTKPTNGRKYGASDGGPPEYATEEQLSRLTDAMWNAQLAGMDQAQVAKIFGLDKNMAGEWNYAKWTYKAAK